MKTTVVFKEFKARRILVADGDGSVAYGRIVDSDGKEFHALRFEHAGEETVRFALSDEAHAALIALLTDPAAGDPWVIPSDYRQMMTFEWRVVRDEDLADDARPADPA
jgi:hypothetical protein